MIRNTVRSLLAVLPLIILLALAPAVCAQDDLHDQETDSVETSGHEGHDHGVATPSSIDDAGHEDEGALELTPEAVRMAGITLSKVIRRAIGSSIHLPGEIGFNEDRLVHVVPRFAGIAKSAQKRVGDYVNAGDLIARVESNVSMSTYTITAPISGWVIAKHLAPGEFVSEEHDIYVIADLSQVWVNLAVYPKDADKIVPGQEVTLHAIGSDIHTTGTIEYLTPVLDARTRSMTARIVLSNPDNTWRPGTFVHADIVTDHDRERLVVKKNAVQMLDNEQIVFVPEGPGHFLPIQVVVGESDMEYIEILGGLEEGMEYVSTGAFELKAKIVTSDLGGHAGHGH